MGVMNSQELLSKLIYIDKDAREYGFQWPNHTSVLKQIINECHEVKEAIETNKDVKIIEEEVSDVFHAVISLCLYLNLDVDRLTTIAIDKFSARMDALKKIAESEHKLLNLHGQETKLKVELWEKVKTYVSEAK